MRGAEIVQVQENVKLSTKTTFHIGGMVKKLYIPENEEELIKVTSDIYDRDGKVYIIAGGSNLLVNDKRIFDAVIGMKEACNTLVDEGQGRFYIGASNRIQKVISFVNEKGYGGFEELVGLPAMFGGIIYMNAGIGDEKEPIFTISEFVNKVRAYDLKDKKIVIFSREECNFSHRKSIFQSGQYIILGAEIKCKEIDAADSTKRRKSRIEFCRQNFDYGQGCFGSCFSQCNGKLMRVLAILNRRCTGVSFSKKTCNWLVNNGNGTFDEAMSLIHKCERIHKLFLQKIEREVIIWK